MARDERTNLEALEMPREEAEAIAEAIRREDCPVGSRCTAGGRERPFSAGPR